MVQPSDRSGGPSDAGDRGTWIGEVDPPADFVSAPPADPGATPMARDRKLLIGLGGLILVWLAVVGLGRVAAPDEIAQPPAPTSAPAPTATPMPTPTPMPAPTPELEVPAEDVDGAQLGARMGASVQVERMVRQLGRRGSDAMLAYRSAQGIMLVDLAAGTADTDLEAGMRQIADFLDLAVPDDAWPEVVARCRIDAMRAVARGTQAGKRVGFRDGADSFFFKGGSGRGAGLLPDEVMAQVDELIAQLLPPEAAAWLDAGGQLRS